MPRPTRCQLVLVTSPDLKTARALAKAFLTDRLVACVNLIPKIESHYWWKGRLERGNEVLLVMKTTQARLRALEKRVHELHPYQTPEFLVVPVGRGSAAYLAWIGAEVGTQG